MQSNTLKINALTGIRAFAALWVVLLHFRINEGIAGVINFDWLASRGYWGVDIFFVLSGFILTHTYYRSFNDKAFNRQAFTKFLLKRFARIYPLHLATFLAFIGLTLYGAYWSADIINPERCTLGTIIPNLLLLHAWGTTDALSWNYPSWSISAEWFAYLVLVILGARILWRAEIKHSYRVVIYSWLAICLWVGWQGFGVDHYSVNGVLRIIPEFLAGCLLYRIALSGKGRNWKSYGIILAPLGIFLLSLQSRNFEFLLLPLIGILLLSLYHGTKLGELVCGNRVVVFLGEISYSIYLTHPFAQMIGDALVRAIDPSASPLTGWLILSLELVLVVLCGALGYFLVERPCRRWIVRRYESTQRIQQSKQSNPIHSTP